MISLTYSHAPSQRPMYKGLKAREGLSSSLTSPSRFFFKPSRHYEIGVNVTQNVRVT